MDKLKDIKVGTALGVAFIGLFCAIYLSIGYNKIDSELQKYGNSYYKFYVNK